MSRVITLAHGFGGKRSQELLDEIILPALAGPGGHAACGGHPFAVHHAPTLDAAVIADLDGPIVVSTDGFTVSPLEFPGGDIGTLAVNGTVNDLAMMGAHPRYLALACIIEEGFDLDRFRTLMQSVGNACRAAGVLVITGDTKVVERGSAGGLFLTTTGIGTRVFGPVGPDRIHPGDIVLLSGTVGDHGAAILNARENLGFTGTLASDCAPLHDLAASVAAAAGERLHALRDPTRGGLAATLNEFALDGGVQITVRETDIPVRPSVASFLDILGMDPLTLANEGKMVAVVAPDAADAALAAMREHEYGAGAAAIGTVDDARDPGRVVLETVIGTRRLLDMPLEAGLPRIC